MAWPARADAGKKSAAAAEHDRPDAKAERLAWPDQIAGVPAADFVSLDEFGAATNAGRTHARSPRGERAVAEEPRGHRKVLATVAAMTVGGMLAAATVDAAVDGDVFRAFVRDGLVPALRRGQVVVTRSWPPP